MPSVAAGPAERIKALSKQRETIEAELRSYNSILEKNGVGMHDRLVDDDDFPRADIDIFEVRRARNRIICLQNDYKALMKQIEENLYELHSQYKNSNETMTNGNGHHAMEVEEPEAGPSTSSDELPKPFVVFQNIIQGSPVDIAGFKEKDEIVQFGSVNPSNFRDVQNISDVVRNSVNRPILVKVLRNSRILDYSLTPQSWSGRGLLGCSVFPTST